jgi:hypothetical protein
MPQPGQGLVLTTPQQKAQDKQATIPGTPDNILVAYLKRVIDSAHATTVNGHRLDSPHLPKGALKAAVVMLRRELNDIALDRKTGETQGGEVLHG